MVTEKYSKMWKLSEGDLKDDKGKGRTVVNNRWFILMRDFVDKYNILYRKYYETAYPLTGRTMNTKF